MKSWLVGLLYYFFQLAIITGVVFLASVMVDGYEFTNAHFLNVTVFYTLFRLTQIEVDNHLK